MNLKTAARRLGVHYQTAYRWVRTGQLVAVRVGAGYEISDAALARFQAQRSALGRAPEPEGRVTLEPTLTTACALGILDDMAEATLVDAMVIEARATQLVATILGDAVAVHCCDPHGTMRLEAFDHRCPKRASLMSAMLRPEQLGEPAYAQRVGYGGEAVLIPQVPQRDIRALLPPEFHQFLSVCGFYSAISVPILARGELRGALSAARDTPGRPYSADDLDFVTRVAARVANAIERADLARAAWELRSGLRRELADVFDTAGHLPDTEWLNARLDDDQPVAIVDLDQRLHAASKGFGAVMGRTVADLLGEPLSELVAPTDDLLTLFERLKAGELDYCTVGTCPRFADGRLVLDGASVRLADATPWCVLYIARGVPELARV
ncbi:MAG: GAF domain-containing protein [Acidimicrobiia bacterium]